MKRFFLFLIAFALVWFGYHWLTAPERESDTESVSLPPVIMEGVDTSMKNDTVMEQKNGSAMEETAMTMETKTESENIRVTSPEPNAVLLSPFPIAGEARVFEGTVIVRVTNASGDTLIQEVATTHAADIGMFGPFSMNLSYAFQNTKQGYVEVYSESAKDGSVENLVRIPVTFE